MNFITKKTSTTALLLSILLINTACQSASTPTDNNPALDSPSKSKIISEPGSVALSAIPILAQINELEIAFANKNCDKVLELAKNLEVNISEQSLSSIPPLSALAIITCEAKHSPQDNHKLKLAHKIYDLVMRKTNNVFNKEFFELYPYGNFALINNKIEAELSPQNRQLFEQIIIESHSNSELISALQKLDNLNTEQLGTESKALILRIKANIIGKLETIFFIEIQNLEEKKLANVDAAKNYASEIKQRFPLPTYVARVDAIISGNTIILQNPSLPSNAVIPANNGIPQPEAVNPEKIIQDARAAIDSGDAEKALTILATIQEKDVNDKIKRLKKEASEQHVKELRLRVSGIYSRITKQNPPKETKLEGLKQCKTLLELILSRYPDTSAKSRVEYSLKSIITEINSLTKE